MRQNRAIEVHSKKTRIALGFAEEVTGTQCDELLSPAAPGQVLKQALRFFISVVSALEHQFTLLY